MGWNASLTPPTPAGVEDIRSPCALQSASHAPRRAAGLPSIAACGQVPECSGNSDSPKKHFTVLPGSSKENASPSVAFPVMAAAFPLLPSGQSASRRILPLFCPLPSVVVRCRPLLSGVSGMSGKATKPGAALIQ